MRFCPCRTLGDQQFDPEEDEPGQDEPVARAEEQSAPFWPAAKAENRQPGPSKPPIGQVSKPAPRQEPKCEGIHMFPGTQPPVERQNQPYKDQGYQDEESVLPGSE